MRILPRALSGFFLFSLLAVCPASAWVLLEDGHGHPLHWGSMPVTYHLVAGNAPAGAAGEDAVHRAFDTWSRASRNVSYRFGGYVDRGVQQLDRRNLVYWIYQNWPYDSRLAAITFHYFDTRDGRLLDADIVFNGERYSWSIGGSAFDIENSAAHEVGHFNGLGHSSDPEATMYARTQGGETKKRNLSGDDVAGLEALYGGTREGATAGVAGTGTGASGVGGGGGGCSIASHRPAPMGDLVWIGFLLIVVSVGHRKRLRDAGRRMAASPGGHG